MSIGIDAKIAIERGLAFLEARQLPGGELPVQASPSRTMDREPADDASVFPTALMIHSLSFAPGSERIRERALDFLEAEMLRDGFWKHWPRQHPQAHLLPPDLDDTCSAALVMARGGRTFPDHRKAILANRDGRGLFRTWRLSWREFRHPLALYLFFRRTSARPDDVDAVVNANVLAWLGLVPETRPIVEMLMNVLREGAEQSCDKWYERPFAVWYFFSRALHPHHAEAGTLIRRRIATTPRLALLDEALAACSLLYWNEKPDEQAIAQLLAAQLDSGGWPRAGLYHGGRHRLPDGGFSDPHPDTPWWGSEELTAAFCIEALSRWLVRTHS